LLFLSSALIGVNGGCTPREPDERFEQMRFVNATGDSLSYRLFIPDGSDADSLHPLVVFLHGGRGSGTDNISQISGDNWSGSHVWIGPDGHMEYDAFVAAPQLPLLGRWDFTNSCEMSKYGDLVVELAGELLDDHSIDPDRVYLTGQSLGGWGVWDIATKRPDLFAAAIPVCGGGNPKIVSDMRGVPIWVFHGARDGQISVERSREMVEALRKTGSNVRYTEIGFPDIRFGTKPTSKRGWWTGCSRNERAVMIMSKTWEVSDGRVLVVEDAKTASLLVVARDLKDCDDKIAALEEVLRELRAQA
jgi:predicted peptidase